MQYLKRITSLISLLLLGSCTGIPEGIEPVKDFKVDKYLGKWYEIARLDHSFERDLSRVTAEYSKRENGGIKVINTGFNQETNEWKTAEGKAFFVEDPQTGYLKVSFFGPFYGSYIIFHIDDDYQYAYVTSHNRDYLWLLAREKNVPPSIKAKFEEKVEALDFKLDELMYVAH